MFIFQSLSDFTRQKVPDKLYVADYKKVAVVFGSPHIQKFKWRANQLSWELLLCAKAHRGMRVQGYWTMIVAVIDGWIEQW